MLWVSRRPGDREIYLRLLMVWTPARQSIPLLAAVAALASCEDPARVDDPTTTASSGVTVSGTNPSTDPTSDTTGGMESSTSSQVDGSSTSTGPVVEPCETVDCDGFCCNADEECVLQECLPTCETAVRCGDDLSVCCPEGDVCLEGECVTAGAACLDSYDCPEGEFCELTLNPEEPEGACLTQPEDLSCEILPDFNEIEPELEWSWDEQQIIGIPIVADVDGDDLPEVIVSTTYYDLNGDGIESTNFPEGHRVGIVVVFEGESGEEKFRIVNTPSDCGPEEICDAYGSYGRSTLGVADVDGNGLPDIIYTGRPEGNPNLNRSRVHAVNGAGEHLWTSNQTIFIRAGAPAFANFDDDPESEIVFGAAILDNDGTVVWDQDDDGGSFGSPSGYRGPIAAIADLNDDDAPEVISGRNAWTVNWTPGGPPTVTLEPLWDAGGEDGFPAIADLDQNGTPEVILVAGGEVRVLDGATGELWCGIDPDGSDCENNDAARTQPFPFPEIIVDVEEDRGGPPTVADFDGDGRPEFAAAGAGGYVVFDANREGEDVVQPDGQLPPAPGDIYVRWLSATQDQTSRSTGSSVFDFQGDGVAEVLYADECFMRVFNGETGEVIVEIENSSATIHEYPIVVDADGDGNSEILVVANDVGAAERCGANFPDYTPRRGLYVYGDPNDAWVRTRRVWNSHTYHVTNSDSRGLTPETLEDNWTVPGLNNYRQNFQGAGVFNAPDLAVDLQVDFESCLDEAFEIQAIVRNEGALGVPAGIDVTLYAGTDGSGEVVGTQETEVGLLPGAFTVVSWLVAAPGGDPLDFYVEVDSDDVNPVTECDESDNSGATATVSCPPAG